MYSTAAVNWAVKDFYTDTLYINIHSHTHIYIYIYIYTHTYIHTLYMLHSQIWVCEIDIFIQIQKTFTNIHMRIGIRKARNTYNSLFWFKYETFYYLFEFKVFWHEERETQFLQQTRGTFHRPQLVLLRRDQKSTTFL